MKKEEIKEKISNKLKKLPKNIESKERDKLVINKLIIPVTTLAHPQKTFINEGIECKYSCKL